MTANELKKYILTNFDALYNNAAPGFEDPELSVLASKAQLLYVLKCLKPYKDNEVFEETEVRKQGLSALIKDGAEATVPPAELPTTVGTLPGERYWKLPSDFMFAIYEAAETSVPFCKTNTFRRIPIFPIQHNEYNQNFYNTFKKPYCDGEFGIVWRINHGRINNDRIHGLITDTTFTVTNYFLRYLKFPTNIVIDEDTPSNQVNPELDEVFQYAIGDLAIMLLDKAIRESVPISQLNINELI